MSDKPNIAGRGRIPVYILAAEKALGRRLPAGTQIHHADGDKSNNRNNNLVICPDDYYHKLLHVRFRALKGCGDPDKRSCMFCKVYDEKKHMTKLSFRETWYHLGCQRKYQTEWSKR